MSTLEMFRSGEDSRRQWRRIPVSLTMNCRRLGRGEAAFTVEAVDLSPGGVRLRGVEMLNTGDVVLCWMGSQEPSRGCLKGLVVQVRPVNDGKADGHVAWTNLSAESVEELSRLLALHDEKKASADTEPAP